MVQSIVSYPKGYFVGGGAAVGDEGSSPWIISWPGRELLLAKEVLIIEPEFLEAGACHVGELNLHLLRGAAGFTTFGDVLDTTSGGLDHLVVSAAVATDIGIAETNCDIVAKLCDLE